MAYELGVGWRAMFCVRDIEMSLQDFAARKASRRMTAIDFERERER